MPSRKDLLAEIPAFKVRGQWRIRRAELDRWMDKQPRGGADGED